MRVLVASDSFKDALPADAVCAAIARGLARARPNWRVRPFPLSDGGEGALEVLSGHLGLQRVAAPASDPLGRPITAEYGLRGDLAVIEMARTAGLEQLELAERNPLKTSTFGVGTLIVDALGRGARRLILAIGGSATTDAGIGMAAALGWRFLDIAGAPVEPTGAGMARVARVIPPEAPLDLDVQVMSDVANPLHGPNGAAWIYGRQKGGTDAALAALDAGLANVAARAGRQDLAQTPGAGAAGGLGFGAMAFLGARLRPGADLVMDLCGFDAALRDCDLVITGEGRLDGQTLNGKLVTAVCRRARPVPVVALCGALSATADQLRAIGLQDAWSINTEEQPLAELLAATEGNLEKAAALIAERLG